MEKIPLAGFELIEQLGQGGMGVVWKARQLSLDRLVAIKMIPPEMIRSPEDIRMILQEARAAAKLKHSGIVQIHDACEQNGAYFLVMEYIEGYNLGQWLARKTQLGVKDVLLIAESVATALDHAWHATGLIHCDIKPENIMVDQDGTIKVADLGLSRSRDATDVGAMDEIMGTPAYMSPEQVQGDREVDCRTDIYSLGAMMYQLLTGKRPFSEKSDDEAMESQITGFLCDPRDIVPGLPGCVCALLERMLVKDRDGRPKNWSKVLADLRRVSRGMMPLSPAPAPGASTLACRKVVATKSSKMEIVPQSESGGGLPWRLVLLLVVLVVVGAVYWYYKQSIGPGQSLTTSVGVAVPVLSPEPERATESLQLLEETRRWCRANSNAYAAAFARYHNIVDRYPDTIAAGMALEDMKKLRLCQNGAIAEAWSVIHLRANQLVSESKENEALAFVENYAGAWSVETASNRMELAKELRRSLSAGEIARTELEKWNAFLDQTGDLILASKLKEALEGVQDAVRAGTYPGKAAGLGELAAMLQEALDAPARIRQSFLTDVGRVIVLPMGRARMQVRVTGISGQKITGTLVDTGAEVLVHPDDLPAEERLRRIGEPTSAGMALAKGVMATGMRMYPLADDLFGRTGELLSGLLQSKLKLNKAGMGSEQVAAALGRVLYTAGITVGPYSEGAWIKAIESAKPSAQQLKGLNEQREKFLAEYGVSEFAMRAAPVLLVLERQCQMWSEGKGIEEETRTSESGSSDDPGAAYASLVRRLVERNPGLLPKDVVSYPLNDSQGIKVVSDSVVDVGVLGEGSRIKGLWLESQGASDLKIDLQPLLRSGIADLRMRGYLPRDFSVLRGMPLRHLTITGVSSPSYGWLEGLPLVELDLTGSGIRELGVLHGMRIRKLVLDGTKVAGVAPLAGMPIRELSCRGTAIRDVTVLRGLPLVSLDLSQTPVTECSVLRGLNLVSLDISKTGVRDISFCAGMPLEKLALSGTAVEDIACLRGKNLKRLILSRTGITDISPLAGASIATLDISGTRVPPVNLLRYLPKVMVKELSLEDLDITRVDFLKGQQLNRLSLKGTAVSDISILQGMPLKILDLRGLRLMDPSVLYSIPTLESLWCDVDALQAGVLFDRIPGLNSINGHGRPDVVRW